MRVSLIAVCAVVFSSSTAFAYLGGFEKNDGYQDIFASPAPFPGFYPNNFDVVKYNAGSHGLNVDGSAASLITPGTGLWDKLQGPLMPQQGLLFPAPPVPPAPPFSGYAYATGHRGFDRTFVNSKVTVGPVNTFTAGAILDQGLVITTNNDGWNMGTSEYSYKLDQYDTRGLVASGPSAPTASPANSKINLSFWACSQLLGTGEQGGGLGPNTIGNTVSFYDSSLTPNLGFEVGYIQPGTTQDYIAYRLGGGSWVNTNIPVPVNSQATFNDPVSGEPFNNLNYHRWDISLDLLADKVDISLFDDDQNLTHTLVTGAPIGNMTDLAELRFASSPGINNLKRFSVDDFNFCVTEAPLSELLEGGTLWSGDKQFSEFEYHGGGDMPAAEDIFVKAITDADGNVGIRFQGAFVDAFGGGASDALIDFKVTAPAGKLIKDVHMAANPLVIGGSNKSGLISVTETFLSDNDQTVLSVFDIAPGSRQLTDWADLVDENGNLAPVQELHVQKDILAWTQGLGSAATMSFIDQTFSQCDADPMNPGSCIITQPGSEMYPAPDFNGDGFVDAADYTVWRDGLGTKYTEDDFLVWREFFGQSVGTGASSASAIPEPATAWLLAIAFAAFGLTKRRTN